MASLPTDRAALQELGRNPRVAAFKPVIRYGESNLTERAYHLRYPNTYFTSLAQHPQVFVPLPDGRKSSAAGAYQITWTTWSELVAKYGFTSFGIAEQEEACTALIARCGALPLLLAGDVAGAIAAARLTWTSLPGAAENSRRAWTMQAALDLYHRALGAPSVPAQDAPTPADVVDANPYDEPHHENEPTKEATMPFPLALLISTFGPAIINAIPQVKKWFDPAIPVAQRNVGLAETVINTIVEVSGRADLPTALDAMSADPVLAKTVQQAVVTHPEVMGLLEVGGGIAKAREFAVQVQNAERPFWYNPVFWITLLFFPLIGWIVGSVLIGGVEIRADAPWWADAFFKLFGLQFTPEVRAGTVGTVLGTVLGGITGIWFGTSYGSLKKDERTRSTDSPTAKE
jgi:muramidase (phage lysozyme)